jgi:3-oxoacyl-[acyl-carrier protein] reductase
MSTSSRGRLGDQVALVTGASSGIGRAVARELAARGAQVVLVSRTAADLEDAAREIRQAGGAAVPAVADVTDPRAVSEAVETARSQFGPVGLAVHCAGTAGVVGPLWESDLEEWWSEVAAHAKGAATVAHAVLPDMIARGRGRIVNAYGNLGDRGGSYCSAYACGKAGLLRLTEHLHAETHPHGVHVFAFHPGLVETPMTRRLAASDDARRWLPRAAEVWPQRWQSPQAAAALVARIAEGELDAFAGRLVGAWEDLEDAAAPADPDVRTLRVSLP